MKIAPLCAGAAALCALASLPSSAWGEGDFLKREVVNAIEVKEALPADPRDRFWDRLPFFPVSARPQTTIRLPDRQVNEGLGARQGHAVFVRAAFNDRELGLVLDWADETEDRVRADETSTFGDAAAIEIPERFGAGVRLPYVGMGDDEMKVLIYHQRASVDGAGRGVAVAREAVAAGFGSGTRGDLGRVRPAMRYEDKLKQWRAVFVRPLAIAGSDLRRPLVPFAVAVWDGAHHERGGNKLLSRWKFLRLARYPLDAAYVSEMSYGYGPGDLGDAARGKSLAGNLCIGCHRMPGRAYAPLGLAPDLAGVGNIATPAYLRQSLTEPSAIIVPNPNVNQHENRNVAPDARGAFPNNDQFIWFTRDAAGKKVSKMPPFNTLPKEDVAALVAYMAALQAGPSGAEAKR